MLNEVQPADADDMQQRGAPQPQPAGQGAPHYPVDGLVAAVKRLGDVSDPDQIIRELQVQHDIFAEKDAAKRATYAAAFAEIIRSSSTLTSFVGMRGGFLRIIHSIQRFGGDIVEVTAYDRKVIGFMGDRRNHKDPLAVVVEDALFDWGVDEFVTSERTLKAFYAKPENKFSLFSPADSDTKEKTALPPLLMIPRGAVEYLNARPRTPMDYHDWLLAQVASDPDNRPPAVELSLVWCRGVSHLGREAGKSAGELTVDPVFKDDHASLARWMEGRLATTLGLPMPPQQHVTYNNYAAAQAGGNPPTFGEANGNVESTSTAATAPREKDKLTEMQKATIQGFCHVMRDTDLPEIWKDMEKCTDADEVRKLIAKAMDAVRKIMKVDSSEMTAFKFEEPVVKEWKKACFAPGGKYPYWEYLMRGMSILACMTLTTKAKMQMDEDERTWKLTESNRMEEQARTRNKKDPRTPPTGWSEVKYLVTTYGILLQTLFTKNCHHYETVWTLREAIVSMKESVQLIVSSSRTEFLDIVPPSERDLVESGFRVGDAAFRAGRVAATTQAKEKYWGHWYWYSYATSLGMDPYLPPESTRYQGMLRAVSGFAGLVKTGYYGHGREVGTGTVSKALAAIGQTISMGRPYNPLKMNGSNNLLHPLAVIMSGLKKWDKPVEKKQPVEADVVEMLCLLGQTGIATTKDGVIGDWVLIAFYYLLRVGEYTQKGTRQNSKQTVEYRLKDVAVFNYDDRKRLKVIPLRKENMARILNAAGATLKISNQKNGWKNVSIFHFANGEPVACPVKALGRRIVHLLEHTEDFKAKLSAYWVHGVKYHLTDQDVRDSLKFAAKELDYPTLRNIEIDQIDTHSLRAGGANALALNGYSDREIQKMGRWRGETFKEYIRENLAQFSRDMSSKMKKTFQYVNIQGTGNNSEMVEMTKELVNTPYETHVSRSAAAA